MRVVGYSTRPTGELALPHPAYSYRLAPASRALLLPADSVESAVEVVMPNGQVMRFHSDSSREDQERISREYHEITAKAQADIRRSHLLFYVLLALVPCLVVGLFGIGIAWVRKGFAGPSRAEP